MTKQLILAALILMSGCSSKAPKEHYHEALRIRMEEYVHEQISVGEALKVKESQMPTPRELVIEQDGIVQQDGRPEKTRYVDMTTGEHLLPPRVKSRTVQRYKLDSIDGNGRMTYRRFGVETLAWPIDTEPAQQRFQFSK